MKAIMSFIILPATIVALCISMAIDFSHSTEWIGPPVISTWKQGGDGLYRAVGVDEKSNPSIEIGFRSDGLVVWRETNKDQHDSDPVR